MHIYTFVTSEMQLRDGDSATVTHGAGSVCSMHGCVCVCRGGRMRARVYFFVSSTRDMTLITRDMTHTRDTSTHLRHICLFVSICLLLNCESLCVCIRKRGCPREEGVFSLGLVLFQLVDLQ
jgi:hypothetical protein